MRKKISLSWSGGKDSAFALYKVLQAKELEVKSLHTSFNEALRRVGMHGTPESLIEAQAKAAELPLEKILIPSDSTNKSYEGAMLEYYYSLKEKGIEAVVFGDIFLEDLKLYREELLAKAGLRGIFPLWQQNTQQLIQEFLQAGFKTAVCAADAKYFTKEAAGKVIDQAFIGSLAEGVDPCGERGEFHTFVFEGPIFQHPIPYQSREVLHKSYSLGGPSGENLGFWFADLALATPYS